MYVHTNPKQEHLRLSRLHGKWALRDAHASNVSHVRHREAGDRLVATISHALPHKGTGFDFGILYVIMCVAFDDQFCHCRQPIVEGRDPQEWKNIIMLK